MAELLDSRALNRALLARQGLLERWPISADDATERLVGLQAQSPTAPYYGLWSRLESFSPEDLARLLQSGEAVRTVLMRSTVHLVTARDAQRLRPRLAAMLERRLLHGSPWGRALDGTDLEALSASGRELLEQEPRTNPELARLLVERFPGRDGASMTQALRTLLPLVQLPPRGIWGEGGVVRLTTLDAWVGTADVPELTLDDLVRRYLAAFGPGSVLDAQTWCGLTRLGEVFERLRQELVTFRDAHGRELFDVPEAPRPAADVPAPPRFLPEYDNALVSHHDRQRIIDPAHRETVFTKGTLLVDGFVRGTWKLTPRSRSTTLAIDVFRRLSKRDLAAVEREGHRLVGFAAPAANDASIQINASS